MRDEVADHLLRESEAAAALLSDIGRDDEELANDMIEGETSLLEAIEFALNGLDDAEVIIEGCKAKEKQISDRRARAERRRETIRALIERALATADVATLKTPTATLTLRSTPIKALYSEEADIPAEYWRKPDPVLDKKKINDALADGAEIPGVTLSNGGVSVNIRRA